MFSLERRWLRGYLIELYKIMRGKDRVDSQRFISRVEVSIISFKVRGRKFKGDMSGRFFTQSVVGAWNVLPEDVIEWTDMVRVRAVAFFLFN